MRTPHLIQLLLLAGGVCMLGAPANAEVYKCADAKGRVTYSGTPCAVSDVGAQKVKLAPATSGASLRTSTAAAEPGSVSSSARAPDKICPSERDISNLETQASSNGLDDKARAFVLDEVRRARSCAREDTRYTREDWARIQNSIRDQNRSLDRDRQAAREDALSVHKTAGSAEERERIENEKNREALREAALIREREAEAARVPVVR